MAKKCDVDLAAINVDCLRREALITRLPVAGFVQQIIRENYYYYTLPARQWSKVRTSVRLFFRT